MNNSSTTAISAAEWSLLEWKVASRALNAVSIVLLTMAIAFMAPVFWPTAPERTGYGLLIAVSMIVGGYLLSRRHQDNLLWCLATSLVGAGYGLACFVLYATHYLHGLSTLSSPLPCWLLMLCLSSAAVVQTSNNPVLRWLALPFALLTAAHVFSQALTSTETLTLFGFQPKISALACLLALVWSGGVSAAYRKLALNSSSSQAVNVMYQVGHEVSFVAAGLSALALPLYWSTMEYAPVCWAIEMPLLLLICWQSRFLKHTLVIGIWALSAVLVLLSRHEGLTPLMRMAVPLSGMAMALAYQHFTLNWEQHRKNIAYSIYLYGAVVVALAVPFMQLSLWSATGYLLPTVAVLLFLGLILKDRIVELAGAVASLAALALFGLHWQLWTWPWVIAVVAGCYVFSLVFRHVKNLGGWPISAFVPLRSTQSLSRAEAVTMEIAATLLGCAGLNTSLWLMLPGGSGEPVSINTISMGVAAYLVIGLGFAVKHFSKAVQAKNMLQKFVGFGGVYRATGIFSLFLTCGKLVFVDLGTMEWDLMRIGVSALAVGMCFVVASFFWLSIKSGLIDVPQNGPDE